MKITNYHCKSLNYVADNLQIKFEFGVLTHVVELVVESARVADRFAAAIAPPQRGRGGSAVGADSALSARRVLCFWMDRNV